MLDTDMCLAYRNNRDFVVCELEYGKDATECTEFAGLGTYLKATEGECCAWTRSNTLFRMTDDFVRDEDLFEY